MDHQRSSISSLNSSLPTCYIPPSPPLEEDQLSHPPPPSTPTMQAWTPPSTAHRPVVVLGGGVLGRRIAATWLAGGFDVHMRDPSAEQRTAALSYIATSGASYAKYVDGSTTRPGTMHAFAELAPAVRDAWLVIESVPERLALKVATFAELEAAAPADCLLCTNSSSYRSGDLVGGVSAEGRKRVLNMHYMMPPDNRVVELMTDGVTAEGVFPFLVERLRAIGMHPIVARKESTGFVFNRLWAAIKREVLTILAEGVSVPEELDAVWMEMYVSFRFPFSSSGEIRFSRHGFGAVCT